MVQATRRQAIGWALGGGAAAAAAPALAQSSPASPRLIDAVAAACRRLAPLGWREMMLRASGGALDLNAADLAAELAKPLPTVDRSVSGFADFAPDGLRGVEPGKPSHSLLHHAFACPDVSGPELRGYPTAAEIEAVESYCYGARPPSLASLRAIAGERELRVVTFALQYRCARDTVHGRHADHVFSRVGVSRMGTIPHAWNAAARGFDPLDPQQPFAFRPVPQRFAPFIAMKATPGQPGFPASLDPAEGDEAREFWIPLHKLFPGSECLAGVNVGLTPQARFRNEKLRRFHRYLQLQGFGSEWGGEHLNRYPFVIEDDRIATFSSGGDLGPGWVLPRPQPFVNRAEYQGRPLTFEVPAGWTSEDGVTFFSSGQILGGSADTPDGIRETAYLEAELRDYDRSAPEYISLRHVVRDDGTVEDLNRDPRMMERIRAGGYRAQHYIDFSGDGWVTCEVTGLGELGRPLPAYATVSPPDFFPAVSQRDLVTWWRNEVPSAVRASLWAMPPYALSQRRMTPNLDHAVGFSVYDTTATAVVGAPFDGAPLPAHGRRGMARYSGLPDHSPGVFDPGWDASFSTYYNNPEEELVLYLQNYGLGTPFVEDVKLCAALGSYWPAVAPDSARSFSPNKQAPGFDYPWPAIVPLTDVETGIEPAPNGRPMPWDGVRGPRTVTRGGRRYAAYADIMRVDYITLPNTMTAALLARIDLEETKARVMATERVYWALGVRDPEIMAEHVGDAAGGRIAVVRAKAGWAVVSFKPAEDGAELAAAEHEAGARLQGDRRYRYHVYRPGPDQPAPGDMFTVHVPMTEEHVLYVGGDTVLMKAGNGRWTRGASIPA